jgi:hypothetical protein
VTFRFSDGLGLALELLALVRLDPRPATRRVGSARLTRWPHLGPILAPRNDPYSASRSGSVVRRSGANGTRGSKSGQRWAQCNERDHREVDTAFASFRGPHVNHALRMPILDCHDTPSSVYVGAGFEVIVTCGLWAMS